MVTSKRPLSPSGDDAYANLPLHHSPSANSYIVNKKRRISSASSKSSFLGRKLAHGWERVTSFLTPRKRTPAPPVSEDGDTIDSASTIMGEDERGEIPNGHSGEIGNRTGRLDKAGSSHTLGNGMLRPRHLDDMLLPAAVAQEDRPRRDEGKAQGSADRLLDKRASEIIEGIFAEGDAIEKIFAKAKRRLPPLSSKTPPSLDVSSSAGPSRSRSPVDGLANGTVKGKGKARASSLDTDVDATPTQLGSRSRPLDLTSPSLRPRSNGDAPPDLLYRSSSDPQPIAASHDPPLLLAPNPTSPLHPPTLHFDLDNSGYQRHYGWIAGTRRSPISVASSSTSTSSERYLRKKKSRNLWDKQSDSAQAWHEAAALSSLEQQYRDAPEGERKILGRSIERMKAKIRHRRKVNAASVMRAINASANSRSALASRIVPVDGFKRMMRTQLDPAAQFRKPAQPSFDPRRSAAVAIEARKRSGDQRYTSNVEDILERMKIEEEQQEAAIKKRLAPAIPKHLTDEQSAVVSKSLRNSSFEMINGSECVNHHSLTRLAPNTWLNDEVINFYGAMLKARAEKEGKIKLHYFNSFFYQKLESQGYVKSKLARWTKKVDIFDMDLIIFPVNVQSIHWTAGAIDFRKKRIEYYDSLGDGRDLRDVFFENIREYLQAEHLDKKKTDFDLTGWTDEYNDNSPQQDNGSDCGVFSCQTLENRSRGKDLIKGEFEFTSKNMRYFRDLMIWEIATKQLLKRW